MWEIWRRHKRNVYVTLGVFGSGYIFYKLYEAHRRRLSDLERELASERENDELLKAQMQSHFESIQRIADTTLPHAMIYLSNRVVEELDLLHLWERLERGKRQPDTLTPSEKLELWDRLKILSFTRMVLSMWAMTMLSLYIRVQVNILGRHLYIETARDIGASDMLEEADLIHRNDQQQFLATVDFLSTYGMTTLISSMQEAATDVLKGKRLQDIFNTTLLHETIVQILDVFMSMEGPHSWVDYLMPEASGFYKRVSTSSTKNINISDLDKFDQLMMETRSVLSSAEFGHIVDISLKTIVDELMEDIKVQFAESNMILGMPLAKLLPRLGKMGLLEEPSRNRFIQIIRNLPEVDVFFTLLYANMSTSE